MEAGDFVKHVMESLVYNDLHEALSHSNFEKTVNSFARLMKHAYEAGKVQLDVEKYYDNERPAGSSIGENVR